MARMALLEQVLADIRAQLVDLGIEDSEAACEAEIIVEHVTGWRSTERILKKKEELTSQWATAIQRILDRRVQREPLQYVLGEAHFAGLVLKVGPGVFIPRADTERVVEVVLDLLRDVKAPMLAEACAGSGAISLAVLSARADATVSACERSHAAFNYARENAQRLELSSRFRLVERDWRQWLADLSPNSLDAFMSNPPYIPKSEQPTLAPELDYEPAEALFGWDEDGLGFYRAAARAVPLCLKQGGFVALEIGDSYPRECLRIFSEAPWKRAELHCDLSGKPRVVSAFV